MEASGLCARHANGLENPHSTVLTREEERRLAYVGLTRAKKRASISFVMNRRVHNQWQNNPPSRFLRELSEEDIEILR